MNTQVFTYHNSPITFSLDGEVMVNATEMAKPFGKQPASFLRNAQTEAFIAALQETYLNEDRQAYKTTNGGVNFGTWMCLPLAIEFSRWLNPAFNEWFISACRDSGIASELPVFRAIRHEKRFELDITTCLKGIVTIIPQYKVSKYSLDFYIPSLNLAIEYDETHHTRQANADELRESVIKAVIGCEFIRVKKGFESQGINEILTRVLTLKSAIATTVVAAELGKSAVWLHRELKARGIMWVVGGTWVLTAKYKDKGYTVSKTHTYLDSLGQSKTSIQTYWTEKGREFIHSVFNTALAVA